MNRSNNYVYEALTLLNNCLLGENNNYLVKMWLFLNLNQIAKSKSIFHEEFLLWNKFFCSSKPHLLTIHLAAFLDFVFKSFATYGCCHSCFFKIIIFTPTVK